METIWGGEALALLGVGGEGVAITQPQSRLLLHLTPPTPPTSLSASAPPSGLQRLSCAISSSFRRPEYAQVLSRIFFFFNPPTVLSRAAVSSGSKHNIPTKTLLGHWAQRLGAGFFFPPFLPYLHMLDTRLSPCKIQRCISKYAPASFKSYLPQMLPVSRKNDSPLM